MTTEPQTTAEAQEPAEIFAGHTWKSTHGENCLVLEPTSADDHEVNLWIGAPTDGPGATLTPKQMRQLAAHLVRRADKLDPPDRRWLDVPHTPEAIIGDYLATAKASAERVFDLDEDEKQRHSRILHLVDSFTVVALMAELLAVSPARATALAQLLADAWDDGGTVHELVWEWHEAHAKGKPVGFEPAAVLELEVERRG